MLQVEMSASKRDDFGKCAMRRLRKSGNTPAVLYGNNKEASALQFETTSFLKGLFKISRKNAVVNLTVNGSDTRHAMVRDLQTDPVNDSLIHVDFLEIDLAVPRRFTVPITFVGKAKGLEFGGDLVVHSSSVQVTGLPLDIPDTINVGMTNLGIGESIKFSDIEIPENLKMVTKASTVCVEIVATAKSAEAAAAAAKKPAKGKAAKK
ncbi:ribosomal protein L25, Ctc-form [Desulfocapsa sulfexigens DSM 10523]|uniref:Large ribosomal subunit protein bL25 n=1 Tax=Desulfocapsa sulfexigens (strain DSM 10523 / SB164P1) TaxID=1167006 RepID=M1P6G7_DESSD|nr:50S ribosomal protein L25 [Desulfocapsa sulfexigens]AGF79033.1 ribosomal protein L25, Ctc-form [Desulfocapsa sulfexigens DSM 10523]